MNQRADSRKKNVARFMAKPLIDGRAAFESHRAESRTGKRRSCPQRLQRGRDRIRQHVAVRDADSREDRGAVATRRALQRIRQAQFAALTCRQLAQPQRRGSARVRLQLPDSVPARLSRRCRPDARWPAGRVSRNFAGLATAVEEGAALRRKLRSAADHAGRDAVDVRDFGAAQPKRIAAAGLLLLERIGVADCRSD